MENLYIDDQTPSAISKMTLRQDRGVIHFRCMDKSRESGCKRSPEEIGGKT